MSRRYGYRYRSRGYSRNYRKHYRKHRNRTPNIIRGIRTTGKIAREVAKPVWWVADKAIASGTKFGFGMLKGIINLGRR